MLNITFEDLENVRFNKEKLDITLYFINKNRATLHFDTFEEYKRYRDYFIGLFIC